MEPGVETARRQDVTDSFVSRSRRAGAGIAFPPEGFTVGVTSLIEIAAFRNGRRDHDWWAALVPQSIGTMRRLVGDTVSVLYQVAASKKSGWTLMDASDKIVPPGIEPGCMAMTPSEVTGKATETAATGVYVFNELFQASYCHGDTSPGDTPKLLVEAITEDFWGRQRHEGYGFLDLPQVHGRLEVEVPLWKTPSSNPQRDAWCGTFDPLLSRSLIVFDTRGQQRGANSALVPGKGDTKFIRGLKNGVVDVKIDTVVIFP
ncbi:hypothetical protein FOL47_006772 [Perkinsus chesapeaki]|uniref:Uncharacterized protein n=1 Tax=Perkinsus chesapeaki TaxID=330153 RepID=A0A7J6LQU7_PERCH|nr:hypothetical protein FOL47_006772 [Perkinsus chesapeaki]